MRKSIKNMGFLMSLVLMIVISVFLMCVCMCIGRYKISLTELFGILVCQDNNNTTVYNVLYHIRIPRIMVAYIIGMALACSGVAYQSLFNNRLVSPGILGVDAGACVGAGICILLGYNSVMISFCAFLMGTVSAFLAVTIQKLARSDSTSILVLAGIIVSALMNSAIGLIKYLADTHNKLASITFWIMGDLSGAELSDLYVLLPVTVLCLSIIYFFRWRLNAFSLGVRTATSLGINYKSESLLLILCATLLTSVSVSVAGSIGWVGLIIPNVARGIYGSDNKKIIPASILLGGIFMVVVDTLARSLSPTEIPLGIITGILGAITFLYIIIQKGQYVR